MLLIIVLLIRNHLGDNFDYVNLNVEVESVAFIRVNREIVDLRCGGGDDDDDVNMNGY